jgi:hypothetical protein
MRRPGRNLDPSWQAPGWNGCGSWPGKAIVNYWTCEYLPDGRMQDVIDLRVAILDSAWFYGA